MKKRLHASPLMREAKIGYEGNMSLLIRKILQVYIENKKAKV